jgi:hypothetical protein
MKRITRYLLAITAAAALLGVVGCNTVSVQTRQDLGLPTYPPTDPATVQILRTAPTAPHVRLGEITAEPASVDTPVAQIETKLQQAAAKIGANAVVIVVDRTQVVGATVVGGWYNRQLSPDIGRVIIGVPIRYTH